MLPNEPFSIYFLPISLTRNQNLRYNHKLCLSIVVCDRLLAVILLFAKHCDHRFRFAFGHHGSSYRSRGYICDHTVRPVLPKIQFHIMVVLLVESTPDLAGNHHVHR